MAEIQNAYEHFGTLLLEDENGSKIKGVTMAAHGTPVDITVEILHQWLQGRGRLPVTWRTLVECLEDAKLNVAAGHIENALSQEVNSDVPDSSTEQQTQPCM